jgi:hypothetical protein
VRRADRALPDHARVHGRRSNACPSADRDRALRELERREARRRARAAPLRDEEGPTRPSSRSGGRARARAFRAGSARTPPDDAVQVAVLAHLRVVLERSPRGRLRRPAGRGAPGPGRRAGRARRASPEAPPAVRRLGGSASARPPAADRVAGLPPVRRKARGLGALSVRRAKPLARRRSGGRGRRAAEDLPHRGGRSERCEPGEAEAALFGRADCGQELLGEGAVGLEGLAPCDAAVDER